ncbi:MAG: DUF4124 domain-containing protein [Steroidobacteraceae bacterium]
MRHSRFTLIRPTIVQAIAAGLAGIVCLGLLCAGALADDNGGKTTVYKWVDAQGVVHYSDQPHPNAQKLEISGAQTFAAPPTSAYTPAAQETQPAGPAYQSCVIAQPTDQQMLMNAYQATAVVQTSPPLRPGDQVHLFVDGKQLPGSGTAFTFSVVRGQHSVQAVVEDYSGQIVCETSTVTFYVHQPSIRNPANPVHPH